MMIDLQAALGSNPISVAAPAKDGDSFVLDMATTSVAMGKVNSNHNNIHIRNARYV